MKKNLIFDLGGVLIDLQVESVFAALAKMNVKSAFLDEAHCFADDVMSRFERGLATEKEMFSHIIETLPPDVAAIEGIEEKVKDIWNSMLGRVRREKFELLKKLRAEGHRIYLLSNTNVTHWAVVENIVMKETGEHVEDFFDDIFLSFRLGCRKPAKEIFEKVLLLSGADASDTAFFDDSADNCSAAEALGITSFLVPRNGDLPIFDVK